MEISRISSTFSFVQPIQDKLAAPTEALDHLVDQAQEDPYDLGLEISQHRSSKDQVPSHPFQSCDGTCSCGCSVSCHSCGDNCHVATK